MGKKLHLDMAAEREANDIGRKFMNSTDVVGDMSRAYGADLSSVKIHTDSAAAGMAAQRGVDAFSTGKDVFFGRGVFDKNNPESRGLLAHELSHSLQQGVGGMGGMQQSAPMGAAQGGLLTWFRDHKRKKREQEEYGRKKREQEEYGDLVENLEISEPTLLHTTNKDVMEPTTFIDKETRDENGDIANREFMNYRSFVLNRMVAGLSKEELQNPALLKLVQEDYNTNMNKRLKAIPKGAERQAVDSQFRGKAGELHTLNAVLGSFIPEGYSENVMNVYKKAEKKPDRDPAMDAAQYMMDTMSSNKPLMEFMGGLGASFDGVQYYDGDEFAQSDKLMNNLALRTVNAEVANRIGNEKKAVSARMKAQGVTDQKAIYDAQMKVDSSDLTRCGKVMKALNLIGASGNTTGDTATGGFSSLLVERLIKRKSKK